MARITKADLEADVSMLRWNVKKLQDELSQERDKAELYKAQYTIVLKYISTMSEAVGRVSDALAHSIGYVTDPNRAKHIQHISDKIYEEKYSRQEPDTRTFMDLHKADKEKDRCGH